jgi:hypothetical protein
MKNPESRAFNAEPEVASPSVDILPKENDAVEYDIAELPQLTFAALYDQKVDPEIVASYVQHNGKQYHVLRIDDGSLVKYPANQSPVV